jgi:hypothetical protein
VIFVGVEWLDGRMNDVPTLRSNFRKAIVVGIIINFFLLHLLSLAPNYPHAIHIGLVDLHVLPNVHLPFISAIAPML